jgi:secreted trypsin-like serine protease
MMTMTTMKMKGMCRTTSASLKLWYLLLLVSVGMNSVQASSRIVGGMNVTNQNEFPFYAIPNSNTTLCGATLIWGNVLITAAHCGESTWNAGVWIGGTNALFNKTNSQYYSTQRVIIHPNYDPKLVLNDIALIILNTTVKDIPYAQLNYDSAVPKISTLVTAIGYGRIAETGAFAPTLQKVDLQVESYKVCVRTYVTAKDNLQICNRGLPEGGKDSCSGDSGGPLFIKGTTILSALVSYGYGCARQRIPAVNTRISAYTGWIQSTICTFKNNTLTAPSYCKV